MRLVIERMGGFDVIEESDRIRSIEVRSDGVAVRFVRPDADAVYPTTDHAEACRLAAAIAQKCGTLVEPLSEGPAVVTQPASEWVDGEPPRDGRWYVVWSEAVGGFNLARWWSGAVRWADPHGTEYATGDIEAHLPTPIPER